MMLHDLNLGFRRQVKLETSAPPSGIFRSAEAMTDAPVENRLKPTAQPRRGLGLGFPDRAQNFYHIRSGDVSNLQGARTGTA